MRKVIKILIMTAVVCSCECPPKRVIYQGEQKQDTIIHEPVDTINKDGKKAKLEFDKNFFVHADIPEGTIITDRFIFTNTGDGQLTITSVFAECKCIKVDYPITPIAPGERNYIDVSFDSKNYEGIIERYVMINSNSTSGHAVLTIRGVVNKNKK